MTNPAQPPQETIAKAVIAVTGSLATAIAVATADSSGLSWIEVTLAILGALGSGAAVWGTTNKPKTS